MLRMRVQSRGVIREIRRRPLRRRRRQIGGASTSDAAAAAARPAQDRVDGEERRRRGVVRGRRRVRVVRRGGDGDSRRRVVRGSPGAPGPASPGGCGDGGRGSHHAPGRGCARLELLGRGRCRGVVVGKVLHIDCKEMEYVFFFAWGNTQYLTLLIATENA